MSSRKIKNIFDMLNEKKELNKIAIEVGNKFLTYKKLFLESTLLAKSLHRMKNGRVIIYLPNSIEFIVAYFALHRLNCVVMPIHYETSVLELQRSYMFCEADLVITDGKKNELIGKENTFINTFCIENGEKNALAEKRRERKNQITEILKTSGSYSTPKYVQFTSESILNNIVGNIKALEIQSEERVLIILPMAFSYCLHAQLLSYIYIGGTIVLKEKNIYTPTEFYRLLTEKRISSFATVPSLIYPYVRKGKLYKIPTLKKIYLGADFSDIELRLKIQSSFVGICLYVTYGMTEAGPRISTLKFESTEKNAVSVGKTLENVECKIVDININEDSDFKKGEIVIKTNSMMEGYYNNPQLTSETINDSWLHTGDYGYIEDANIYLLGRIKNIIKINGMLICPEEIEEFIRQIPNVEEVLVKQEKNYNGKNILVANIVMQHNGISKQDIIQYCTQHLPKEKIPKKIKIVKKIEKTRNGKIIRKQ